jgi:RimJ/RimL family protein N-acetyltransferase
MARASSNPTTARCAVLDALRRTAPRLSPDALDPAAPLRDQVDLDSMDWLNFLAALHESLGVEIPEAEYRNLVTLDDLLTYLEEHGATVPLHPTELVQEHHLLDGRIVTIRPIRSDDANRVRDFLAASSEDSRYKRFQKWVHAPSDNLVHFLTDIDYDRHVALVCTARRGADEEIVGEARYVANPDGKSCDIGVLIEDAWHKTGIAGLLMETLIRTARSRGFATMEGIVFASNTAMLQFARALGFEVEPMAGDRTTLRIHRRLQP